MRSRSRRPATVNCTSRIGISFIQTAKTGPFRAGDRATGGDCPRIRHDPATQPFSLTLIFVLFVSQEFAMLARRLNCCPLCALKSWSETHGSRTAGKWLTLTAARSFLVTSSRWTLFSGLIVTLLSCLDFQFRPGA